MTHELLLFICNFPLALHSFARKCLHPSAQQFPIHITYFIQSLPTLVCSRVFCCVCSSASPFPTKLSHHPPLPSPLCTLPQPAFTKSLSSSFYIRLYAFYFLCICWKSTKCWFLWQLKCCLHMYSVCLCVCISSIQKKTQQNSKRKVKSKQLECNYFLNHEHRTDVCLHSHRTNAILCTTVKCRETGKIMD